MQGLTALAALSEGRDTFRIVASRNIHARIDFEETLRFEHYAQMFGRHATSLSLVSYVSSSLRGLTPANPLVSGYVLCLIEKSKKT
jgi:hypothetical protein